MTQILLGNHYRYSENQLTWIMARSNERQRMNGVTEWMGEEEEGEARYIRTRWVEGHNTEKWIRNAWKSVKWRLSSGDDYDWQSNELFKTRDRWNSTTAAQILGAHLMKNLSGLTHRNSQNGAIWSGSHCQFKKEENTSSFIALSKTAINTSWYRLTFNKCLLYVQIKHV